MVSKSLPLQYNSLLHNALPNVQRVANKIMATAIRSGFCDISCHNDKIVNMGKQFQVHSTVTLTDRNNKIILSSFLKTRLENVPVMHQLLTFNVALPRPRCNQCSDNIERQALVVITTQLALDCNGGWFFFLVISVQ